MDNKLPEMWVPAFEGIDDSLVYHDTCQWCHNVMTNAEIDVAKEDNIALCKKCRVDNYFAERMVDDLRKQGR